ncbi:MAG TPA: nitrilase-related carbon-nitrogen hydrolase, partial [Pedobacter sp.]|uniref:carbon-nitrogen hydrolase family protein n=1 Tax=Pedobacter sp. TaxID=1411316 RepID=UPI002C77ED63
KGNPGLQENFRVFERLATEASAAKPTPDLICFPEYAISGWDYPSEQVINGIAEQIPGKGYWYERYRQLALKTGVPLVGWLVESAGKKLFSTAFMIDGKGNFKGKYRKVHTNLGEQTWWGWAQGDQFKLIELEGVKYGISICSDMWFPESIRCLELMGADVVLHLSIGDDMQQVIPVRAFDSHLPIIAAIFQGGSYAVDGEGISLGKLPAETPAWKAFAVHPFKKYLGQKYGGIWDIKKGQQYVRNVRAYSILTNDDTRPSWTSVFIDDPISPITSKTKLGIDQTAFTLNGKPVFLYGISYYGALGAQESFIQKDLADIKKNGFNWIRIWANWPGSASDISAIDDYGNPVELYMKKLKWIVQECDKAGIVVDVTLAHSNNTNGRSLKTTEAHERAVRSIVTGLKSYQNWYLDLANERDVGDSRFVSFKDLKKMRETAKALYPDLLITASAGNDINRDDLNSYLNLVEVDFISPHRPRTPESASETAAKTRDYLDWMKSMGKLVPVHYQEPFRRGYSNWQPLMKDYVNDLFGAKKAGAGGWCFHNGDQRGGLNHQPGRSFDLHEKRLFDQLDQEELLTIHTLAMRMR